MTDGLKLLKEHRCFNGYQRYYEHQSATIGLPMKFAVYVPDSAKKQRVPVLMFLAGLTCDEDTFTVKAGAQRYASEHGLMLVMPDTSPRGAGAPNEDDDWDFGTGAGFYVDATTAGFAKHYRMDTYISQELFKLVTTKLAGDAQRVGIFGHSMGGHGALVLAQRHPDKFQSVSAFAPIAAPTRCPWGEKAFTGYLGTDRSQWEAYDASCLMTQQTTAPFKKGILIDQGLADQFLERELYPEVFEAACAQVGQPLTLRRHEGFDHGYFFIMSFIEDHITHHIQQL